MTDAPAEPAPRTIVVERDLPHPPERIWRALTQSHLIAEWLMANDFEAALDHRFELRADWGTLEGRVLTVDPPRRLAYSWGDHDLDTVVTWTLTPTATGTLLHMEQAGFRADQPRYYHGARAGWPRLFGQLEALLARID